MLNEYLKKERKGIKSEREGHGRNVVSGTREGEGGKSLT